MIDLTQLEQAIETIAIEDADTGLGTVVVIEDEWAPELPRRRPLI